MLYYIKKLDYLLIAICISALGLIAFAPIYAILEIKYPELYEMTELNWFGFLYNNGGFIAKAFVYWIALTVDAFADAELEDGETYLDFVEYFA
jgi:hypothetical protein